MLPYGINLEFVTIDHVNLFEDVIQIPNFDATID
jgi:hypothetical protein